MILSFLILASYIVYTIFLLQYIICFTKENSWYTASFGVYVPKFALLLYYAYIIQKKKEVSRKAYLLHVLYTLGSDIFMIIVGITQRSSFSTILDAMVNVYVYITFVCIICVLDCLFYIRFDQIDDSSRTFLPL